MDIIDIVVQIRREAAPDMDSTLHPARLSMEMTETSYFDSLLTS